ncbi:MAG: histidine phosphatase family protein [Propionibacteriaceae bacterium]
MPRFYFVRHGESSWNVEKRLQGQTMQVPLTEKGWEQAAQVAAELAERDLGATMLLSSDQDRAMQTAEVIAARLGLQVVAEPALREQSLGSLEGKRHDELVAEPTPTGMDISEIRWGGGESIADVYLRMTALLERIREYDVDSIIMVSHGDAIRVALAAAAGVGHRNVAWIKIGNGEVVAVS